MGLSDPRSHPTHLRGEWVEILPPLRKEETVMGELSLVATADLLDELKLRFAACLFIGNQPRTKTDEDITFDWEGERYALMGLAARVGHLVQKETDENATEVTP